MWGMCSTEDDRHDCNADPVATMQSCKVAIILCFENVIVLVWYTVDETVMLSRTFHQLEKQF